MIRSFRKLPNVITMALIVAITLLGAGCKSKKKAMEAQAAEKARMEQEALRKQQEEEARQREAELAAERARQEAEAKKREPYQKLERYFASIASSASTASANSSINEALTMFASDDTPVLIVINQSGDQKDYDRPTTIKEYLNYLKDQKRNANRLGTLQFDSNGKITEVELIKR